MRIEGGPQQLQDSNAYINPVELRWRYQDALVAPYEHLPSEAIDDIIINKDMADAVTDPNLLKWFNPDYLFQHAAIFALGRPNGSIPRLQTPTSHRAVILQKDAFFKDEYGNGYGEIAVKGTGSSRRGLKQNIGTDPRGFFGDVHADQEEEVSNILASNGARVGRVIAKMPLNVEAFQEWLGTVERRRKTRYRPLRELDKVVRNGHQPTLIVRAQGTDRIADFDKYNGYFSPARIYGRAARLLLREMESRGYGEFLEHYGLDDKRPLKDDLEWLSFLGEKQNDLEPGVDSPQELNSLNFLYESFSERNYAIARNVSRKYYGGDLSIKNWSQDVGHAGYWYDFETSIPGTDQYHSNLDPETNLIASRHPKLGVYDSERRMQFRTQRPDPPRQGFE